MTIVLKYKVEDKLKTWCKIIILVPLHFVVQAASLPVLALGQQRPTEIFDRSMRSMHLKQHKLQNACLVSHKLLKQIYPSRLMHNEKGKTSVKRVYMVARVNAPRPKGREVVLCASCQSWAFRNKGEQKWAYIGDIIIICIKNKKDHGKRKNFKRIYKLFSDH